MIRCLSLYSGIGGMDRAARSAGMDVVAFCESDPYCRSVLALRHPGVPIYERDTEVTSERLRSDGVFVELIMGGPPCQSASSAGRRGGDTDARWRWPEFIRIVGDVRPRWWVAENPTGILSLRHGSGERAFGGILGALSEVGYSVGWETVRASDSGAPHRRERVFVVGRRMADAGGE